MNLDEMLAASGISGGAAAVNGNTKSGFVTFVGRPNVGKSTLMNRLTEQKMTIKPNKPKTTVTKYRQFLPMNAGRLYLLIHRVFTRQKISWVNIWSVRQKKRLVKSM